MTVRYPFKATSTGLQQMSAGECAYIRYLIRNKYSTDTDAIGWISINSNTGWFNIGSYTDLYRSSGTASVIASYNQAGTLISGSTDPADPGTATGTTYTFYQNRTAAPSAPTTAIQNAGPLVPDGSYSSLAPMSRNGEADVTDTIIDETIRELENGGDGKFYIGTTTPAGYTFLGDTAIDSVTTPGTASTTTTTTYRLSIRTGEASPTVVRPVKFASGGILQEMSDTEILDYFYPYFLRRIGGGNRLYYTFSTATTGVDCGSLAQTYYSSVSAVTAVYSGVTTPGQRTYTYSQDTANLSTTSYYLRLTDT